MTKKKTTPKKKNSDPSVYLWEQDPEQVRRMFATAGELERRREDGDDLFMTFLDPDGILRKEYGEEIERQREILQAIVGLQTYGSSTDIKEAQDVLKSAILVLKWIYLQPGTRYDVDAPRITLNNIAVEMVGLAHRQMMSEHYEEMLRQHGLQYDSDAETAIRKGRRGRPSDAINGLILLQAIALGSKLDGQPLRDEIQRRLSRFFPVSALDTGPRGIIARVIENVNRPTNVRRNERKTGNPK